MGRWISSSSPDRCEPGGRDPGRRAALCAALLAAAAALGGCAAGPAPGPDAAGPPAAPARALTVIYAQSELPLGRSAASSAALARAGYYDLPALMMERIGPVLQANGLQPGRILASDASALPEAARRAARADPDTPVLTIHITGGGAPRPSASGKPELYFRQQADLYRPLPFDRIWTGQFDNALAHSSLPVIRYDRDSVDRMLVDLLQQLTRDGLIPEPARGLRTPAAPGS